MLQHAHPHAAAIQAEVFKAYNDPRFQWFFGAWADVQPNIPTSDWSVLNYASVNDAGKVCGWMWAELDRDTRTVDNFGAINFDPGHSVTFAKDIRRFFARLLCSGWVRISWTICEGNPAESMYDKGVARLGGRIVGRRRMWRRSRVTGEYLDQKLYEVVAEDVPPEVMAYLRQIDPLRTWSCPKP